MHSQPLSEANQKTKTVKLIEATTRSQAFPPLQNKYRKQSTCKEEGFVLAHCLEGFCSPSAVPVGQHIIMGREE